MRWSRAGPAGRATGRWRFRFRGNVRWCLSIGAGGTSAYYDRPVSGPRLPGGVVHKLPADLREALIANATALDAWKDITPLARNEFICWVEDAKQQTTRERRIRRTQEELEEGMRRPCCWPGCKHRERNGA
jgi:Bacteriocin-protection, YdeI or OmpD-Associated